MDINVLNSIVIKLNYYCLFILTRIDRSSYIHPLRTEDETNGIIYYFYNFDEYIHAIPGTKGNENEKDRTYGVWPYIFIYFFYSHA